MSILKKWHETGLARSQIKIRDIKDGILVLLDRRYRLVLKTSAVNFNLKGEREQDVLIDAFKQLLNGLSVPVQILIRTRRMDIERYVRRLENLERKEPIPLYKRQLWAYKEFIRQKIEGSKILSRQFFIVIPFDANLQQEELNLAMRQYVENGEYGSNPQDTQEKVEFQLAKQQLEALSQNIIENLKRLGIRADLLNTDEILELFYTFFNPGQAIGKTLKQQLREDRVKFQLKVSTH